ncbi:MAG TPA: hypothetical protein VFS11_10210, partial [Gemmatimonadales bacterium]|nr:hypothetical protein [Gemmatimonadales bacterium]
MTAALTTVAAPDLEPALTAFRAAVAAHDLTYRYSDDPHEYRRGAASFRRIQDLARALPADVVAR